MPCVWGDHELAGISETFQGGAQLFGARGADAGERSAKVDPFNGLVRLGGLQPDQDVREPGNAGQGGKPAGGGLVLQAGIQVHREDDVVRPGRL